MAVVLDFVNVVVRKAAVQNRFPGGLDAFARQDVPNLIEDNHLLRVGFNSTAEAWDFVGGLEARGLRRRESEAASDLAVISSDDKTSTPSWLIAGTLNGRWACWASDDTPGNSLVDADAGFLLRCAPELYASIAAIAQRCGADVHELAAEGWLAHLHIMRGDAEIWIYCVGDAAGAAPIGLWGRRELTRRSQCQADVALLRDLAAQLVAAGACK